MVNQITSVEIDVILGIKWLREIIRCQHSNRICTSLNSPRFEGRQRGTTVPWIDIPTYGTVARHFLSVRVLYYLPFAISTDLWWSLRTITTECTSAICNMYLCCVLCACRSLECVTPKVYRKTDCSVFKYVHQVFMFDYQYNYNKSTPSVIECKKKKTVLPSTFAIIMQCAN